MRRPRTARRQVRVLARVRRLVRGTTRSRRRRVCRVLASAPTGVNAQNVLSAQTVATAVTVETAETAVPGPVVRVRGTTRSRRRRVCRVQEVAAVLVLVLVLLALTGLVVRVLVGRVQVVRVRTRA